MAYPSLPASPTLTNPDMILPYGDYDSTPSPPQRALRAPEDEWRQDDMKFSIGPPSHMMPITPATPIIYGNGTMLSDIGEVTEAESTPGRKLPGPAERRMLKQAQSNTPLRSSPAMGHHGVRKRSKSASHERKISTGSTSTVTSEGQTVELFKDFDDGVSVDDSNFQGDDEESVADSYSEEVIASETQRLAKRDSILGDEDQNSSAALSRRAEQILLNAKKRLNNMEGNLTRARTSLYTTPSGSLSSIHSSSPLSKSTPSPQESGRLVPLPPSKHRQVYTPGESPSASPGHNRVYSENSIPQTLQTAPFPVRSASAAARYIGRSGLDGSQRSPPFSGSPEDGREDNKRLKASPPHGVHLEPLSEDEGLPEFEVDRASVGSSIDGGYVSSSGEHQGLTRSASSMQMRDLRDQMHDLKGRLSVLRDRARDDNMKRRSLQSLRTPSPFTAAEQWYAAAKAYTAPGLSADAGVGQSPLKDGTVEETDTTLEQEQLSRSESNQEPNPDYASSEATSVYEDVGEGYHTLQGLTSNHGAQVLEAEELDNGAAENDQQEDLGEEEYDDEIVNHEELDEYESDASLYHDTQAISHEDREDAFDYEHFFLHSAMGTISQQRHGRRDSFSSEDSVETTRGPTAASPQETSDNDPRSSLSHFRSQSTDSVSTMATFATATEGRGSENGDEGDADNYAVQNVSVQPARSVTPGTAKRLTFGSLSKNGGSEEQQVKQEGTNWPKTAVHDPVERNGTNIHRPSIASFDSFNSTGTTRSFPLINKPKSRQLMTPNGSEVPQSNSLGASPVMNGSTERLQSSPVHMLVRDDQLLVERLVASLGKCVLGLQESSRGSYEGRLWRRRLDAARRILEGEEGAI